MRGKYNFGFNDGYYSGIIDTLYAVIFLMAIAGLIWWLIL